ncbi:hypothetical protein N7476_000293 [Penicillium atrosanguineum]|uniref:Uncharacterized protein n=1 Tax=Penicillium atrosanguineum TaxID=1132637 RepID=A0A9W9QBD5_9EURO|nr:hypothetical protein N7476_000293 [Penicillium atrosanguineum]
MVSCVQAFQFQSLVKSTCHTVGIWEQVLNGTVAANLSTASRDKWLSLSQDCESEMEDQLMHCLNGSSIFCDRLLLSLVGRIPTALVTIAHAKRTAAKHLTLSPRRDDCPCETAPSSEETISLKPSSSSTTTPMDHLTITTTEDPWTTTEKAIDNSDNPGADTTTSVLDSGHGAASRNITASVSASRDDASQPTALPADPQIPNENICLIKKADYDTGHACHCSYGPPKLFVVGECTPVP